MIQRVDVRTMYFFQFVNFGVVFTNPFLALTILWQWSFSACIFGSSYHLQFPATRNLLWARPGHVEIYVKLLLCRYILISSMALCLAEASDHPFKTSAFLGGRAKCYIPSTLNIDLKLWHTQLIVCAVKC